MRYLGIDFGSKRVGTALSDDGGVMAFPHLVFKNSDSLIDELKELCMNESVEKVVMGESKDLSGKRNKIMDDIDKFISRWKNESDIEIVLEPEFLTSHQAAKMQGGKNDKIDASAAAIILQSYLDRAQ